MHGCDLSAVQRLHIFEETSSGRSVVQTIENFQLGVRNIKRMLGAAPRAFGAIRFDSNNNCNVHCVYCHNQRSEELVDPEDFRAFVEHVVTSVDDFQLGCVMEPTLDPRMCDFMAIVARSAARPGRLRLQTNGILLHRHDAARMIEAGLSHISVSVDSAQTSTHKDLRGGTSLAKVERNLREFHAACPTVQMTFLTTVTRANIASARDLIVWGRQLGATAFVFRQMFYYPTNPVVDHSRMPSLVVSPGEFAEFREQMTHDFGKRGITFLDCPTLLERGERTQAVSRGTQHHNTKRAQT
jgi:MoaA/NifB/PqqE/SkfB family radical SAM enzyme